MDEDFHSTLLNIIHEDIKNKESNPGLKLQETNIYQFYQQVVPEPLIITTRLNRETDIFYFNLVLWYYILQLGLLKDDFVIKGGFSIQLMINGEYNTEDIDLKVKNSETAGEIYQKIITMIPRLPSPYTVLNKLDETTQIYKFSLNLNQGIKAFMDIDFSPIPEETQRFFNDIETHERLVRLNTEGRPMLELEYKIYPLRSQINEKDFLINKYQGSLYGIIQQFIREKELIPLFHIKEFKIVEKIIPFMIQCNEQINLIPLMKNKYLPDEEKKQFIIPVINSNIYLFLNIPVTPEYAEYLSIEFANLYLKRVKINQEELPVSTVLYLIHKFQKSYITLIEGLNLKRGRTKWNTRNNNIRRIFNLKNPNRPLTRKEKQNRNQQYGLIHQNLIQQHGIREQKRINNERIRQEREERRLEQERLAEERRLERERLEEERRLEQERIAEERRLEQERIAEERRLERERLARERRLEQERLIRERKEQQLLQQKMEKERREAQSRQNREAHEQRLAEQTKTQGKTGKSQKKIGIKSIPKIKQNKKENNQRNNQNNEKTHKNTLKHNNKSFLNSIIPLRRWSRRSSF